MIKTKYIGLVVLASVLILSILITHVLLTRQLEILEDFKQKAKEYLGTEDFGVWSMEIFVAKTPDGRQYPPQDVVDAYFRQKLQCMMGTLVGGLALSLVLVWVIGSEKYGN